MGNETANLKFILMCFLGFDKTCFGHMSDTDFDDVHVGNITL